MDTGAQLIQLAKQPYKSLVWRTWTKKWKYMKNIIIIQNHLWAHNNTPLQVYFCNMLSRGAHIYQKFKFQRVLGLMSLYCQK